MDAPTSFRRVSFDLRQGPMAGIAFGDPERPVDLLFLHATGFNARTYRALLAPLGERAHVLAVDLRGHGRSGLPAGRLGYASWNRHRDDVIQLIETKLCAPVTIAGHSMGATTGLLVGGKRPDIVRGLCLIDPVILSPTTYAMMHAPGAPLFAEWTFPIARGARKRRAAFETREAMVAALTGRGIFRAFPPDTLQDYVEDGAVEASGGVALACAPEFEARTFAAQRNDPWAAFERAPAPLVILRAEKGSTLPIRAARRIAALRLDARIATIEGTTHALPMERPDRVRAAIESTLVMAGQAALSALD
ncbi:MAG: alpha/beta hydrolase [Alphaproteobacteria bacterium]|nr:alpha/beta hydrolase [Alphaproteobacteria bacterium]